MDGVGDSTQAATMPEAADSLDASKLVGILLTAFDSLQERSGSLSELDRAIGDGDHGTTIARAAGRVRVRLAGADAPSSIGATLQEVGVIFLDLDGGATGPLFGSFFVGMAKSAGDRERIDRGSLPSILHGGLVAVQGLTNAAPGDKTLMDALVPAVEAVATSAARGETLVGELDAGASAAEAGALATTDLRARHGRAKHLGDRVVGHEDPGARSIAILFRGLATGCARAMSTEE